MSAEAIELTEIGCCFGALSVVQGITLSIQSHEFVAFVGPSGCGKTTLLNILAGFQQPTSGSVSCAGKLRTVYQQDGLFPWLTVAENVDLGLRAEPDRTQRARRRDEMLALVGLTSFSGHYPHQLSGGMRQLAELARAMVGNTDILLMDEPFSALDYLVRLRMRHELTRLLAEHRRTVLFVTHDIVEAAQLADRIVVLTERPARIRRVISMTAPHPRGPTDPAVVDATRTIMSAMGLDLETSPV